MLLKEEAKFYITIFNMFVTFLYFAIHVICIVNDTFFKLHKFQAWQQDYYVLMSVINSALKLLITC